jgi:phage terminase large subunit-like protein
VVHSPRATDIANDFDQAQGRVFQAIARMLQPRRSRKSTLAKITNNQIVFPSTGATITAIASDYASAAGANPTLTIFDELWAFTSGPLLAVNSTVFSVRQ